VLRLRQLRVFTGQCLDPTHADVASGTERRSPVSHASQGLDCQMLDWYCEYVRNITVSLDDEIYRQARMIAAERDTSISALVKEFLLALGSGGSHVERLKREERALRERITSFRASDKLSRDELHDRRL
jgi:uncharacterized protein YdaU (DUF1376 family)